MKAKSAQHIAEHLWDDTVVDGSLFDSLMKLSPVIDELKKKREYKQINTEVSSLRAEITARWANIIMEVEDHA